MDTTQMIVLFVGIALVTAIAIYFFVKPTQVATDATSVHGIQEQTITVKGGYSPAVIRLKKGVPARLTFFRDETTSCSEEIVFPDFGIRRMLPAFENTIVELHPDEAGTYEFACGMNMLHGKLIVE